MYKDIARSSIKKCMTKELKIKSMQVYFNWGRKMKNLKQI